MAEKVDRRVRKTKAQLRAGLARLMQKKSIKEITVKDICIALLGKNGDMAFVNRIEKLIADTVLHRLSIRLPKDNRDIEYAYAFCLNGCVGMIKTWLSSENQESTQHMAELTHKLIDNTTHMYLEQALR